MGRLTLHALLSFAQFEREVKAQRIRDKMAASADEFSPRERSSCVLKVARRMMTIGVTDHLFRCAQVPRHFPRRDAFTPFYGGDTEKAFDAKAFMAYPTNS
jgi:hypothetical protein